MKPTFSLIVAIYNVEDYISAFLQSLDSQIYSINDIEIVAVNDGSTDSSKAIFESWMSGRANVTLINQENLGAAAARSVALEIVTGDWVTVADPDDILDPAYFSSVLDFIERDKNSLSSILSTRVYILNDETGEYKDSHPLAQKFRSGERIADLAEEPEAFQLGATAFFQLGHLRENSLNYNPNIRPTFEDAHLIGRYLNTFEHPMVGLVSRAVYYYRKRSAQNSLVQSSWNSTDRFLNTPSLGYLDMLKNISVGGIAPVWAQYMVLYDLLWYFKEDRNMVSKVAWIDIDTRNEFLRLLAQIMEFIEPRTIEEFSCNPHPWALREALRLYCANSKQERVALYEWRPDVYGRAKLTFLYSGSRPHVEFYADGVVRPPIEHDYTVHNYFGQRFLVEESLTLDGREVAVFCDGLLITPRKFSNPKWPRPSKASVDRLKPYVGPSRKKRGKQQASKAIARIRVNSLTTNRSRAQVVLVKAINNGTRLASRLLPDAAKKQIASIVDDATSPKKAGKYADAWLIMDRPDKADDNGEHLYRYLATTRPDINAFFVLSRDSVDWSRLAAEGFRLLEYRSAELYSAAMNASFRISSDATADVMYPAPRELFGPPKGKFVFLQHGVTKDDLSRWLNPKQIDLLITASYEEHQSFVGPDSPYKIRANNVALTGFARYDRLTEIADCSSSETILIMPTWRASIRDELIGYPIESRQAAFSRTDYGRTWLELLNSENLKLLAQSTGYTVEFVVHPSLSKLLPDLDLPAHVTRVDLGTCSFQETLAKAAVFVTDYSSVAFDAAYIDVPSVYFHFDSESVFGGGHNYRKGYYDYSRSGFGPIGFDVETAVDAVRTMLTDVSERERYLERAIDTFVSRDARNRERIVSAIEKL
ncbi:MULTISPECIES: CDP-glycerol glycerophosphotransferase family protein [Brevibacterium]|uniref:CDP-glycerol glycerophosphotransferase, TagB/SpsB family n=1 Tax=Brevibacterium antiquum CNRZ 918 TaxID=1255637 RepID=A0A2H1IHJ8_9MICO|nr:MULTISPECIES: CDP-glycerol glycerophosphotransferase family protein [Brevibacterium]SMX74697.1 CDP-glycerol glycerophosphotransferase, TagB/SpsB family [Brevibacterium antiquum CNRZ 918]HCG54820.1 hypothetical protein [Brevibacterium sp.]